jgi:IS5 family transposase
MRKVRNQQLPLSEVAPDHPKAKELSKISEILDSKHSIFDLVLQDIRTPISAGTNIDRGAAGMTAEQVVRAAIVKQVEGYSYRELAFHLQDSRAYSQFCRIGFTKSYSKSALQQNIKAISAQTWEQINRLLVDYGKENDIEKGRKVRVDCTVVESNIHAPYDSDLLMDAVRVLARNLAMAKTELAGVAMGFSDHRRRAKRRTLEILNTRNAEARRKPYKDLIEIAERTIAYGEKAINTLRSYQSISLETMGVAAFVAGQLDHYLPLARQVVCQARRRILENEKVPAQDKIVSLFEPHTDIIRKDRRDTYYGHKICLTGGASNLITDCVVLDGNPADSTLTGMMLERQKDIYGRAPLKVALDGGFSSKDNLEAAKQIGVKDVCFSKGRGLNAKDMCRSSRVYKGLRRFRAGIESGISWLKRSLGLDRCTWKGYESFKSYVWASVVSANLLTLARQ